MHEARQTFCRDLFSMFHRFGSCSTLSFCLIMQITSYENKGFGVLYLQTIRMLIFEVKFQKKLRISITTSMISSANIDSVT